jgi:hypothetical protein
VKASLGMPATSGEASATILGAPATILEAPVRQLEASPITVEQCGKNNIFFGNTAGELGNYSYYLSFKDFSNSCIQCVFFSMYQYIYVSIYLSNQHMLDVACLQGVIESNSRCT